MNSDKEGNFQAYNNNKNNNISDDLCSESSSHSNIYNKDVFIYSWGKNKYGELGLNTAKNTYFPSPIKTLRLSVIRSVKSGGRNTIILTIDGQILMCGSNIFNLLAINDKFQNNELYQKNFKSLKFFEENNIIVKEIDVAEFHSLALNENGEVYGWGGNLFNKLGQTNGLCGLPSKIYIKRKIISIACGDYHSCALSENGILYSWGGGGESYNKGQCGHGTKKDVEHPKKVEYFTKKGLHIIKIACGGYHTIVMDEKNQLYGFGKGIFGQCGYGQPEDSSTPKIIEFNDKSINKIIDIKCGGEHSMFLSNIGRVYVCGHGYFGQLGLGNNKNIKTPIIVQSLSNKTIIEIGAGWSHSLVLTDEGNIYSSGCGKFGELGLGDNKNRYNYTWIRKLGSLNVKHIFAGGHHSWCLIDEKFPLKDRFIEPEPLSKPNFTMTKRKLSSLSDDNNLSFNETNRRRKKPSNTVDYSKSRRKPYDDENYYGNSDKNNSFDKKLSNNINIIDNGDLKRMIDDYNDQKNNSFNNIDNLIDCFDNINKPDSINKNKKTNNIDKEKEDNNYIRNVININENNNDNSGKNNNLSESYDYNNISDEDNNNQNKLNINEINKNNNNKISGIYNNKDNDDYIGNDFNNDKNSDDLKKNKNINDELNINQNKINKKKYNELNSSKENNDKKISNNIKDNNYNIFNSNSLNDYDNYPDNKKKIVRNDKNNKNNYDATFFYINHLNQNQIYLQVIYSELFLSHRFIHFSISNTNKYYKYDFKTLKNMIMKYLSFDKGNINFVVQDDREVIKGNQKSLDPMMDNLLKEMIDTGLFNSENKKNLSFTIAIVYDYNRNENNRQILQEFKENYNKNYINYTNFKLINENQILNEANSLEGKLSKWTIDFYEHFKELFIYYEYEDNIEVQNYGYNKEKVIKPKFLELRPKIFK